MNDKMRKEVGGFDLFQSILNLLVRAWTLWLSLGRDDLSIFLSLLFFDIILSDSFEESQSGIGVSDVLNSDMDFLGNFSLFDLFFNNNSD